MNRRDAIKAGLAVTMYAATTPLNAFEANTAFTWKMDLASGGYQETKIRHLKKGDVFDHEAINEHGDLERHRCVASGDPYSDADGVWAIPAHTIGWVEVS